MKMVLGGNGFNNSRNLQERDLVGRLESHRLEGVLEENLKIKINFENRCNKKRWRTVVQNKE